MAYAELSDVQARLGILAPAFTATSNPSLNAVTKFIADAAGEIDAAVGGLGFGVPATGEAAAALLGLNADMATLLAIDSRWPGGVGGDQVAALREDLVARLAGAWKAIRAGDYPAIVLLGVGAEVAVGADSFWQEEPDYGLLGSESVARARGESPFVQPGVERGMKL